jgi:hypothetical protein
VAHKLAATPSAWELVPSPVIPALEGGVAEPRLQPARA